MSVESDRERKEREETNKQIRERENSTVIAVGDSRAVPCSMHQRKG